MQREAPAAYMQFDDSASRRCSRSALMVGAMLLTSWLERARFGMSLLAIKQDEAAAEAAGHRHAGVENESHRR